MKCLHDSAMATPLIGLIFENVVDSINIRSRGDKALFVCIFYLRDHFSHKFLSIRHINAMYATFI